MCSEWSAAHQGPHTDALGHLPAPKGSLFCPAPIAVAAVIAVTEKGSFMEKRRLCVLTRLFHNTACKPELRLSS